MIENLVSIRVTIVEKSVVDKVNFSYLNKVHIEKIRLLLKMHFPVSFRHSSPIVEVHLPFAYSSQVSSVKSSHSTELKRRPC